jgi:catechol 2,3-dioxygenase-like lactoylglutathione lyase family enzyme
VQQPQPCASPIAIRQIDHVVLRVRDLERAVGFYVGVLGCREERRLEALGLVQLRAGASLIDLVPVDSALGKAGGAGPGPEGRNLDHIALRIERLDAAVLEHLAARGIEVGERARRYGAEGMGWSVYLRDPDNNVIELRGDPDGAGPHG